ncbi:unnamed protein product [Withania somnifera]
MSTFSGDETAPFFGFLGAAAALVFSCMGAAYGTAKSGVGVASMGVMRPELVMKSIVPVVMAGVLGIYGLIIAVIISTGINPKTKSYYLFDGYAHLSSGLACGLAGLSAGMAIGIVGDAGVRYSFLPFCSFHALLSSCYFMPVPVDLDLRHPISLRIRLKLITTIMLPVKTGL